MEGAQDAATVNSFSSHSGTARLAFPSPPTSTNPADIHRPLANGPPSVSNAMATTTTMAADISPEIYIPVGCLALPSHHLAMKLHSVRTLSKTGWIRVEQIVSSDGNFTIARVYVLPDDLANGRLDRSDSRLRRSRDKLLDSLDFSPDTWDASRIETYQENPPQPQPFPSVAPSAHLDNQDQDKDMSLLQMFNSIPSPSPDINTITDWTAHEFMSDILDGTIQGLTTDLYPYQRRSASLMHQREAAPAPTLDPRLCQVLDQNHNLYYYDSVTREIRRDPRYYDSPRGGILAEEMGSGKTLICLALITATKDQPAEIPEIYQANNITIRPRIASLMDMVAATATRNSFPWRRHLETGLETCIKAIKRNPGYYYRPRPQSSRRSRFLQGDQPPYKIYLSHATFVVVPINLLEQWTQEIAKHAPSLKVHILKRGNTKRTQQPSVHDLIYVDIILCSTQALEALWQDYKRQEQDGSWTLNCVLGSIRYKRCIVDEGHKLGNPGLTGPNTSLLRALDALHADARWIVTGTPSKGLFGAEQDGADAATLDATVAKQERQDLERIGSMVTWYLKARPWSNTSRDSGDTPADWRAYIMQPSHSHSRQIGGRRDCLRFLLNSLIIRHRLSEVSHLLPDVDAKVVRLEGSYQDKLSLNIFSMMIIFNAVQSERTDQDYLFHPRNRKNLLELVSNLRQATFFGGPFYSNKDVQQAVETAEEFLREKKVPIDASDDELLRSAIAFGEEAKRNKIKKYANRFHEVPIYIQHFPSTTGTVWSLDGRGKDEMGLLCTHSQRMVAVQKLLRPFLESPIGLHTYLNGNDFENAAFRLLIEEHERIQWQAKKSVTTMLAGKTKLGEDRLSNRKHHSTAINEESIPTPPHTPETSIEIAAPLANTQLVSTISVKLSYLIDAIVKYQKDEQIIVFYENDNVGYYLASILDMLQVQHLIYAKKLSSARRAQYITTFNHSTKFRVLCMDISQAAFGLDLRSASRIYFINPVHDPQVEAQAIGRVRRISQQKKVTVETLVLKDSLEEVIAERKHSMSQAEHRRCKTILDDRPIYDWIRNVKIVPLPEVDIDDRPSQMARLAAPQLIFGREFGREVSHPDEDILLYDPVTAAANEKQSADDAKPSEAEAKRLAGLRTKFGRMQKVQLQSPTPGSSSTRSSPAPTPQVQPVKRARFADEAGESSSASFRVAPASERSSDMLPAPSAKRIRFSEAT